MVQTKICSACHKELPIAYFGKKAGTRDGLQYSCKTCYNKSRREYNKSHPEILTGVSERYYKKHKKEVLERARRIYHRNIENKG